MSSPSIVLIGQSPEVEGLRWESDSRLRVGRFSGSVDVVLSDATISPHHAEVVSTRQGWVVRDLGSMHGTYLNGEPLNGTQQILRDNDQVRFGRLQLGVQIAAAVVPEPPAGPKTSEAAPPTEPIPPIAQAPPGIRTTSSFLRVLATARQSWDEAVGAITSNKVGSWQGKHMRALLRAGCAASPVAAPDELLQSILDDAVAVLDAQRGAILLADEQTGHLRLRGLSLARPTLRNRGTHSHTLAERCFVNGESLLCADARVEAAILNARTVAHGTMTSIVCALLRTPRGRLGVLHLDRGALQVPFGREEFLLADALAATVSVGIESAQLVARQREQFVQTIAALGRAVAFRDRSTPAQTNRVTEYALLLAKEMRVAPQEQAVLQLGTPLHDIGKIGVADAILGKPDRLTADEFEQVKTHTLKGAAILETVPSLQSVLPIVRHHHERWDGTGYPDRLAGDQISLMARIVAVADAFDAMTSDRPYRRALALDHAFQELLDRAGSHFDPTCVRAFLSARAQVETIHRQKSAPLGAEGVRKLTLQE